MLFQFEMATQTTVGSKVCSVTMINACFNLISSAQLILSLQRRLSSGVPVAIVSDMLNLLKVIYMLVLTGFSLTAVAGTWTRLDNQTLTFSGSITAGELERFQEKYSPEVRELRVRSGGGLVIEALPIGEILARNSDLTIVVYDYCMSSCANYFFTAAKHKIIEGSVVGFHGNATSTVNSPDQAEFMRQLMIENPEKYQQERQMWMDVVRREQQFLLSLGVDQQLFDISAEKTRSKEYQMYAPDVETMNEYGIKNITGTQSLPQVLQQQNIRIDFDRHDDN